MSHSTHTPGPWFVDSDTDVVRADGSFIATTHAPDSAVGTTEEYENARLVAASPRLLAALVRLSTAAERRETPMGDPCALMAAQAELRDANREALAAIAEATVVAS